MASHERVDVGIVGGGVAGLAVAAGVVSAGGSVAVFESRDRVGGRLLSSGPSRDGASFDLGATWFWANEPRVRNLIAELSLDVHQQHLAGDAVYHGPDGPQRIDGNPIDVPSGRFTGGAAGLTSAMADRLPDGIVRLNSSVAAIAYDGSAFRLEGDGLAEITARHVVLALPPALAVHRIRFSPELPERLAGLAAVTPVWMGNIAKVVAHYSEPFWRRNGLAGAAISHYGPMREIHDMSGPDGNPAALFGFIGLSDGQPTPTESEVIDQLGFLFGPDAAQPLTVHIADWRAEPDTSPPGVERLTAYQTFGHELYQRPTGDGRLHWASTETSTESPGHIEGALAGAERTLGHVLADLAIG